MYAITFLLSLHENIMIDNKCSRDRIVNHSLNDINHFFRFYKYFFHNVCVNVYRISNIISLFPHSRIKFVSKCHFNVTI